MKNHFDENYLAHWIELKNSHLNRLDLRDRLKNHSTAERILEMKVELKKMYLFASPYEGTILKLWGKKKHPTRGCLYKTSSKY